jgi:hypothetical protein
MLNFFHPLAKNLAHGVEHELAGLTLPPTPCTLALYPIRQTELGVSWARNVGLTCTASLLRCCLSGAALLIYLILESVHNYMETSRTSPLFLLILPNRKLGNGL